MEPAFKTGAILGDKTLLRDRLESGRAMRDNRYNFWAKADAGGVAAPRPLISFALGVERSLNAEFSNDRRRHHHHRSRRHHCGHHRHRRNRRHHHRRHRCDDLHVDGLHSRSWHDLENQHRSVRKWQLRRHRPFPRSRSHVNDRFPDPTQLGPTTRCRVARKVLAGHRLCSQKPNSQHTDSCSSSSFASQTARRNSELPAADTATGKIDTIRTTRRVEDC